MCTVTMNWNGTDITGVPTFIVQDELRTGAPIGSHSDGPGVLSCRSKISGGTINWHYADRMISASSNGNFIVRLGSIRSQVLQNENNLLPTGGRPEAFLNGLWSCTQDGVRLHVGLYSRSPGE